MSFVDVIATLVLVVIIGCAVAYIIRAKKSGKKCIGCPDSGTCGTSRCSGCCGSCKNK